MIRLDRLQERLDALGYNPNLAAQIAGLGRDYVRDIFRGKVREPSASRLKRLADALRCTPAYLTGDSDAVGEGPKFSERFFNASDLVVELPINYRIREGFHETNGEILDDVNWPVRTLGITDSEQWLELLTYDIAELGLKRGSLLHVVDIASVAMDGISIFERTSTGGDLVERSVRQVNASYGDFILAPAIKSSTDAPAPVFTLAQLVSGKNDSNIRCVGQVLAVYYFVNNTAEKWLRDPTRIYG